MRNETHAEALAALCRWGKCHFARSAKVREFCDRIEAAYRLEMSKIVSKNGADFGQLGDAAAMREALEKIRAAMLAESGMGPTTEFLSIVDNMTQAALSAPPRNCDKFATAEEALEYHKRTNCAKRRYCAYRDGCPTDGSCIVNYLLAPATEQKGATVRWNNEQEEGGERWA